MLDLVHRPSQKMIKLKFSSLECFQVLKLKHICVKKKIPYQRQKMKNIDDIRYCATVISSASSPLKTVNKKNKNRPSIKFRQICCWQKSKKKKTKTGKKQFLLFSQKNAKQFFENCVFFSRYKQEMYKVISYFLAPASPTTITREKMKRNAGK